VSGASSRAAPSETGHAIGLPQGEPTVRVEVTRDLTASADDVARVVADVPVLARCLPGAELTEDLGDGWYRGRARVGLGPVRLSFACLARVVEHDRDHVRVHAQGEDVGGGRVQADIGLWVRQEGSGTRVHAEALVWLTGRIAQFGRSLAGDVSQSMFEQFAASVQRAATGAPPPPDRAAPAVRPLASAVAERLRRALRRALPRRLRRALPRRLRRALRQRPGTKRSRP
jgi:carbon monoxide dehydrogenase subunit G